MGHMHESFFIGMLWFWWVLWVIIWLGFIVAAWNILDVLLKKESSEETIKKEFKNSREVLEND